MTIDVEDIIPSGTLIEVVPECKARIEDGYFRILKQEVGLIVDFIGIENISEWMVFSGFDDDDNDPLNLVKVYQVMIQGTIVEIPDREITHVFLEK